MTQAQSPLNDVLAAAANAASGNAENVAQPISQEDVSQAETVIDHQPAVANQQVATYQQPASPLSMDSNVVQAQSSITDYFKLTDGGCSVGDVKYDPIKVRLRLEDAQKGGGFKPAFMMNYEAPSGMVYTKSYDGITTISNNPAHSNLPWTTNVERIKKLNPNAYDYLGYDLAFVVAEDTVSKDKKTTLPAGTVLGYTTPYTAAKKLKKVWDSAVAANKRGSDAILIVAGEEISKNSKTYKQLVVLEQGYDSPKNIAVEPEDAE